MDAVKGLEAPRTSNDNDITVLDAEEVRALLTAAEAEGSGAAAAFALAVFGGIRMLEVSKLKWGDVGEDHVEIGKHVAKKHARRLVPICPTLRAWLAATRGDASDDTLIVPPSWPEINKNVRARAGWAVVARLLKNTPKPHRGPWPANSPRHTSASVQVAIGTSLERLTFAFGHGGGHDLLKRHYVGRMTKKDAMAILSIGPNGSKVKLLQTA
jgi:integrase